MSTRDTTPCDNDDDACYGPYCGMPEGSCETCRYADTAPWAVHPGDKPHRDPRVPWLVHRSRRTLDPDAATRAGVPLDTPAPAEPCPFAGTAPWIHREDPEPLRDWEAQ